MEFKVDVFFFHTIFPSSLSFFISLSYIYIFFSLDERERERATDRLIQVNDCGFFSSTRYEKEQMVTISNLREMSKREKEKEVRERERERERRKKRGRRKERHWEW